MMSFRLYFCGIIVLATIFVASGTFAPAQPTTDFAPWKDAKNAEDVPDWARRMLNRLRDLTDTAREEALAKNLAALTEIASDSNVVPSTRYNAILAIGQLDASPGNPPDAYPAALPCLIDFYQQADSPHYIRYGALLGIVRHSLCGVEPSQQDKVIALLLGTVASEIESGHSCPSEPAVWNWFRLTALDGLSGLKTTGTNGRVAAELLAILNRKSQELEAWRGSQDMFNREAWRQICRTIELASKIAKTLGDLDYPSATDIDAKKMTDSFVKLTQAVCDITYQIVANYIESGRTSPDSAILMEQLVIHVKTGIQSVIWGIRSGVLPPGRPGERSFYATLESEDLSRKRLDALMAEIVELSIFLDEGDRSRRTTAIPGVPMPRAFKFDLSEFRDALKQCSEALSKIRDEESNTVSTAKDYEILS